MFAFDTALDALVISPPASGSAEAVVIPRSVLRQLGWQVDELHRVLPKRFHKPVLYTR